MQPGFIMLISISMGVIIGVFCYYLLKNLETPATMEKEVKRVIAELSYYAEVRAWTDEEKLSFVVTHLEDYLPGEYISRVRGALSVRDYTYLVRSLLINK